jgi:ectoine hydroxylase-related dioxygenase (phytanoyl-CoA dioxygenase family)
MDISKQYNDQGYVVIKQLFNQALIENITNIVDRIYAQWFAKNSDEYIKNQLVNMHSLTNPGYFEHHQRERIRLFELLAPKELTDLIESIFGSGIYFHNSQLFFNPCPHSQPTKLPYWHRDLQYSSIAEAIQAREQANLLTLHIRIPLIAEKGVELIPQTHQRWDSELERNVRFELNGHANHEKLPGTVLIALEPGDILIFNAQMIHRGNYALNPDRKALDLCVGKEHALVSGSLDRQNLPNEQEIEQISNNQWYRLARDIAAQNTDTSVNRAIAAN